jgi:hypothetical protein
MKAKAEPYELSLYAPNSPVTGELSETKRSGMLNHLVNFFGIVNSTCSDSADTPLASRTAVPSNLIFSPAKLIAIACISYSPSLAYLFCGGGSESTSSSIKKNCEESGSAKAALGIFLRLAAFDSILGQFL